MSKMVVGWKEKAALTELGIERIKVKIDTGAKTSSLHAKDINIFTKDNVEYVSFKTAPSRQFPKRIIECTAKIIDYRKITSSNGHTQSRYIIRTPITIGGKTWNIDISLTERSKMRYKMLLGREAMKNILVSPHQAYISPAEK